MEARILGHEEAEPALDMVGRRRRWLDPRQALTLTSYAETYSARARLTPRIRGKEIVRGKRRDGSTRTNTRPPRQCSPLGTHE